MKVLPDGRTHSQASYDLTERESQDHSKYEIQIHNRLTGGITRFFAEDLELVQNQGRNFNENDCVTGPNGQHRFMVKAWRGCRRWDDFQARTYPDGRSRGLLGRGQGPALLSQLSDIEPDLENSKGRAVIEIEATSVKSLPDTLKGDPDESLS